MKTGEIVKIRNAAGILTVKLEKELSLQDVTRGIGDDKIPELKRPRFEFHRGKCGSHIGMAKPNVIEPINIYFYLE